MLREKIVASIIMTIFFGWVAAAIVYVQYLCFSSGHAVGYVVAALIDSLVFCVALFHWNEWCNRRLADRRYAEYLESREKSEDLHRSNT